MFFFMVERFIVLKLMPQETEKELLNLFEYNIFCFFPCMTLIWFLLCWHSASTRTTASKVKNRL